MISGIKFRRLKLPKQRSLSDELPHGAWALDLPAIADRGGAITFKPGLNILFGPNGCGKSTILTTLAAHMLALQTGESLISYDSLRETMGKSISHFGRRGAGKPDPVAATVSHDGQPVLYGAPGKLLIGNDRTFDTSFLENYDAGDGIVRGTVRSHGSRALALSQSPLRALLGQRKMADSVLIASSGRRDMLNSTWQAIYDIAAKMLEPTIAKGQPTVLLDEPDSHLSLLMQASIWRDIIGSPAAAERCQIIVATHSPFALAIPHANLIGLPDSYAAACKQAVAQLSSGLGA
ncbi:AAA family ATPase [Bosea sp. RAC05]|uniref:AAA family ATPase n=1 Tax=Bosea sp. RAC05 TaxID=1842539 RepID=UPI00083DF4EC|nr:AAA family ATPase [Bosea sp. RAC05]AOG03275.1 AAA domain protein [Bosea sp. RAC05]